jgi:hypothetical protein
MLFYDFIWIWRMNIHTRANSFWKRRGMPQNLWPWLPWFGKSCSNPLDFESLNFQAPPSMFLKNRCTFQQKHWKMIICTWIFKDFGHVSVWQEHCTGEDELKPKGAIDQAWPLDCRRILVTLVGSGWCWDDPNWLVLCVETTREVGKADC